MIMIIDLVKLHEKTYGYILRTGKKGSYKYWYKESFSGKLYKGKKPSNYIIEYFEKNIEDPPKEMIMENPWANYKSTNPQMIYAKESNVPFNKIGSIKREEIECYEAFLLSKAYKRIFENLKTFPEYYLPINTQKIKLLHKIIFDDLYDWAGEYRNISISKEGFPFPPPDRIPVEMNKLDNKYFNKIDYHKKASIEELSELLAVLSGDLTIIHPFREGNGRTIRLILDIISLAFDYQPADWSILRDLQDKQKFLYCMFDAYKKNYQPLTKFTYGLLCSSNS